MTRQARASIVASPVLVGAVTVLITIVAVFLAYNANAGLPFVPTYDVRAQLPSGAKLIAGNAVRIGGDRVGQITEIETETVEQDGEPVSIAVIEMELDKRVQPLAADTQVIVRPQSLLGLKYVELTPGESEQTLQPGATLSLANATAPVDLEDVLSTFDAETRVAARAALEGYGNAFAGRGPALNVTLRELRPFLTHLQPVMETLSDPDTQLDALFRALGDAAGQAAPVAQVQAALFANAATTFEALARDESALAETIDRSPETLDAAISSFRVQQPFLTEFAELSRDLQPASAALERSLPPFNSALAVGTPVLRETPPTNELAEGVLRQLDELAENPATLMALGNLHRTVDVAAPFVGFVAPYQTVCNYFNYFFTPLSEHLSEEIQGGTLQRAQVVIGNLEQDDGIAHSDADRPADVPAGEDPQEAADAFGPITRLATQFYGPAVTPEGRADCQAGQTGYPDGPLNTTGRYPPTEPGGAHVVLDPDSPGEAGGTYRSRALDIDGLEDVP
ncbi:MAG: MlaD family protein [Thermoleophilaceae bacterium]